MNIGRSWLIAGGIIVLLLLPALAAIIYWKSSGTPTPTKRGLVIILLTSGFEDEVKRLLDVEDKLYLIGAGSDPHELQLSPSDIEVLKKADIIVSMGHSAIDRRVQELAGRGEIKARIINILDIKGVHIPVLPDGVANRHEIFYDPRNLILILDNIRGVMSELRPEKAGLYKANYEKLKGEIEEFIIKYGGLLKGYKAVITTAEIQPAIQWLDVVVVAYIVFDQHESPDAESLGKAIKALDEENVILFTAAILKDHQYIPASVLDQELRKKAEEKGVPIVDTPLGYTGGSVLEKLNNLVTQVIAVKGS